MDGVNKTLYIPLYGRAKVSRQGIILQDKKAEEIWEKEGFVLKGKSKSKWLAYYMSMRAKVFDNWTQKMMHGKATSQDDAFKNGADLTVLHIGCGMDSRILRVKNTAKYWFDVDFPEVITERKKYFTEQGNYRMLCGNAARPGWISTLPKTKEAIVILEGISMYLKTEELQNLFCSLGEHYDKLHIMMDVYTVFGAKASRYKNPINDVGVTKVYGMDEPELILADSGISFVNEHAMAPKSLIRELKGMERVFFSVMFGGRMARKMYRLFEYEK